MDTPLKRCTKCGNEYPPTPEYFNQQKGCKDGLRPDCKVCKRNADHLRYVENIEVERAKDKQRRDQHGKDLREAQRQYRISHPDKTKGSVKRYQKSAKGNLANKTSLYRRRARTLGLPNNFTNADYDRMMSYFGHQCAVCGRQVDFWTTLAADHWIPLSDPRIDNPGTVSGNMIPLCHSRRGAPSGMPACNQSKHNRDPIVWLMTHYESEEVKQIVDRVNAYFKWLQNQDST